MARRINKRFLALLLVVVVVAGAAIAATGYFLLRQSPREIEEMGDWFWRERNLVRAEERYRAALARNPHNVNLLIKLGIVYRQLAQTDPRFAGQDRRAWLTVLERDPRNRTAMHLLLDTYRNDVRQSPRPEPLQRLEDMAGRLLALDPSDVDVQATLYTAPVEAWLRRMEIGDAKLQQSLASLRQLMPQMPFEGEIPRLIAEVELRRAQDMMADRGLTAETRARLDAAAGIIDERVGAVAEAQRTALAASDTFKALGLGVLAERWQAPFMVRFAAMHHRAARVHLQVAQLLGGVRGLTSDSPHVTKAEQAMREADRLLLELQSPESLDVKQGMAQFHLAMRRPAEAEAILRALVEARAEDPVRRLMLAAYLARVPEKRQEALGLVTGILDAAASNPMLANSPVETNAIALTVQLRADMLMAERDPEKRTVLEGQITPHLTRLTQRLGESYDVFKLRGRVAMGKQNWLEAIQSLDRAYRQALLERRDDDELVRLLARSNYFARQIGEAKRLYEVLLADNPGDIDARLLLTQIHIEEREMDRARRHYEVLARVAPNEPQVIRLGLLLRDPAQGGGELYSKLPEATRNDRLAKAQVAMRMQTPEEAIRLLAAVVQDEPSDAEAAALLAEVLIREKQETRALEVVTAALKLKPDHALLERMLKQLQGAGRDELVQLARDQIGRIADEFEREMAWFRHYVSLNQWDEGIGHLMRARALKPDDLPSAEWQFRAHLSRREFDQARAVLTSIAARDPRVGTILRYDLVMAGNDPGRVQEAIRLAKAFTETTGELAESWLLLGKALIADGQFDQASRALSTALQRQSNNAEAMAELIRCYLALDQLTQAQQWVASAQRMFPGNPRFEQFDDQLQLRLGNPAPVIARNEERFAKNRDSAVAYVRMAELYREAAMGLAKRANMTQAKEMMAKAWQTLEEARVQWPDELPVYAAGYRVALESGRAAEAERLLLDFSRRETWSSRPEPHALLAEFYVMTRQPAKAEAALRQSLELDPRNADRALALANFLSSQGKHEDAITLTERLDDPRARALHVDLLIRAGQYDRAELALQALEGDPLAANRQVTLALIKANRRDMAGARKVLEAALEREPANIHVMLEMARLLLVDEARDVNRSIALLERARTLSLQPGAQASVRHMEDEITRRLAEAYRIARRPDRGADVLQQLLEKDPGNRAVRLRIVQLRREQNPVPWASIETLLNDAMANESLSREAVWFAEASRMWMDRGNKAKALEAIAQATQKQGASAGTVRQYLSVLTAAGRPADTVRASEQLLKQAEPALNTAWWIYVERGKAQQALGQAEQAEADLIKALELAGEDNLATGDVLRTIDATIGSAKALQLTKALAERQPLWLAQVAQIHLSLKQMPEAIEAAEKLLAVSNLEPNQRLAALRLAASLYLGVTPKPMAEKALAVLREIEKATPNDYGTLNNLAYVLGEMIQPPRPAEALRYSQRAVDLMARSGTQMPVVQDTHARMLTLAGRVDEAILLLQEVIRRESFIEAHYHLGDAYLRRERYVDARRELRRALELVESRKQNAQGVDEGMAAEIERLLAVTEQKLK